MKKTEIVRAAHKRGDMKTALRVAKGFRIGFTPEESYAMSMAYECMVHPSFYRALGTDVEATITKGVGTLEARLANG